jgi:hypothetical protein
MRIPPETYFQNELGMPRNKVEALSKTVKSTIDTAREKVTK